MGGIEPGRGAVTFQGSWLDCYRANLWLRTANRVLVELARWPAPDGDALGAGAFALVSGVRRRPGDTRARVAPAPGIDIAALFHPDHSLVVHASASASRLRDVRWIAVKTKDGIVDAQRALHGRRSDVDKDNPHLALRVRVHRDQATLLLDTSGQSLDRRGYRERSVEAPLREHLAAACILAAEWDGVGPVVDPMCGSGTLLVEAGWLALGRSPGFLRDTWAFQNLPWFDKWAFQALRADRARVESAVDPETDSVEASEDEAPDSGPRRRTVRLIGLDRNEAAVEAARANLKKAFLRARIQHGYAGEFSPPSGPGLFVLNPPHGERLVEQHRQWERIGELLKQRYKGWRAVLLAGGDDRGRGIHLRPTREFQLWNGPLEASILVYDLY